jgi:uncharacterized DUF497 family protein
MERFSGFDWDDGNEAKCLKHGLTRMEIEWLLSNNPQIAPDIRHSEAENRYIAVGRTAEGRAMFVAFVFRVRNGATFVRPVSARYMHKKEAKRYGQAGN